MFRRHAPDTQSKKIRWNEYEPGVPRPLLSKAHFHGCQNILSLCYTEAKLSMVHMYARGEGSAGGGGNRYKIFSGPAPPPRRPRYIVTLGLGLPFSWGSQLGPSRSFFCSDGASRGGTPSTGGDAAASLKSLVTSDGHRFTEPGKRQPHEMQNMH